MRIVVTGATGNVGTSVLRALAADDAVESIVGLARRLPSIAWPKTTFRRADVAADDLVSLFRGADAVIHLAWLIQPAREQRVRQAVNVDGSTRVFDAVAKADVPALVHASSVGAYSPAPIGRAVDERWPTDGIASSYYSMEKAQVERRLDLLERAHAGLRVVRLRPSLILKREAATEIRRLFLGPLMPGRVVQHVPLLPYPRNLMLQVVATDDIAEAYRLAVRSDVRGAFNIAAAPVLDGPALSRVLGARPQAVPVSVVRAALAASWRLRLQPTSPGWLDLGMAAPVLDTTRARRELGWQPRLSGPEVVEDLLGGLRDHADAPTPPLANETSGRFRRREFSSGVGGSV